MTQQIVHQADFSLRSGAVSVATGVLVQTTSNADIIKAAKRVLRIVPAKASDVSLLLKDGNGEEQAILVLQAIMPKLIDAKFIGEPYKKALEQLAVAIDERG